MLKYSLTALNLLALVIFPVTTISADVGSTLSSQHSALFQTAKTGLPAEYSLIEETVSPTALQTISDWILKQTTPHKRTNRAKGI
jgi:hypothetical protein